MGFPYSYRVEKERLYTFVLVSLIVKIHSDPGRPPGRNVTVWLSAVRMKVVHSRLTLSFDPCFMKTRWAVHLQKHGDGGGGVAGCSVLCESVNAERFDRVL